MDLSLRRVGFSVCNSRLESPMDTGGAVYDHRINFTGSVDFQNVLGRLSENSTVSEWTR